MHQVIKIDTSDFDLQKAMLDELGNISAILPGVEYAVPMAARLGAAQGKIHLSDYAVQRVRNKFNFRSQLTEAGLSNIGFFLLCAGQPVQIPSGFSFPAVVKPVDMAGSINVRKVHNLGELTTAVDAFSQALPNDVGFTASGCVIVEEYIPGKEYSIEGVVRKDGSITIASVTEKLLGAEPYFVEIGHIVGQRYTEAFYTTMSNYTLAVLDAIQLNVGPFHLELRVTPEGRPVAIELADFTGYEVEEYIEGDIYHVDAILANGSMPYFKVSKYLNTCLDFRNGQPLGSVTVDNPEFIATAQIFTQEVCTRLNLENQAIHLELIECHGELVFLEIGGRVGGGEIPFITLRSEGIDLYALWTQAALGIAISPVKTRITGFVMMPNPFSGGYAFDPNMNLSHPLLTYRCIQPGGENSEFSYEDIPAKLHFTGDNQAEVESAITQCMNILQKSIRAV
ncbi:ATP-grasp domain-containing protein [Brenneria uluponensis]|uniref:ATP-grasp domain-containing protein n=1 Tax=Brenneria uluponensis TaxID=3057057 RepID=UPI0028E7FC9C|nr:ATP-grasp domain-containing protein [Brenneria ulupoensis]